MNVLENLNDALTYIEENLELAGCIHESVPALSWEFTKKYWFGKEVKSDWREGSAVTFYDADGQVTDRGIVLTSDPYRLLSYTLQCERDHAVYERKPKITFELKPMGTTVKLTLKHEHPSSNAIQEENDTFNGINNGWPAIMSNLKSWLETGGTLPELTM